jgi:hypothetical protein
VDTGFARILSHLAWVLLKAFKLDYEVIFYSYKFKQQQSNLKTRKTINQLNINTQTTANASKMPLKSPVFVF